LISAGQFGGKGRGKGIFDFQGSGGNAGGPVKNIADFFRLSKIQNSPGGFAA
jgi:hypothetical protein